MNGPPVPRPKSIQDALSRGPEIVKTMTVVQQPLTTSISS